MTNRRTFLKVLAAAGAATAFPLRGAFGQRDVVKLDVRGGAIDVHHHFNMPGSKGNARVPLPWTPERALEQMDKFNIGVAILSRTGGQYYDATEKSRTAARESNDYGAKVMQQYPKRFGLMGGLPVPDIDGSLREIAYVFDTLKVDAIGIHSNDTQGRWPGDPHFEPVWQELNRRNAIVYVHPMVGSCCNRLPYGFDAAMLELDFDATRAVASIVVNGVMFRNPNIRFVTVHSGATVPMLAGRMKDRLPAGSEKYLPNGLYAELRKWHYDVAHATFPWSMAAVRTFMPESQIVFGTDYSPEPMESTVNQIPGLKLPKQFELAMLRTNAEGLFPRFKLSA